MSSDSRTQQEDGVFIEIDEGDPFEKLQMGVLMEDGSGFAVGELEVEPGRYELRKVDDGEKDDTPEYICPVCQYIAHGKEERDKHAGKHPGVKPDAFARY